MKKYVLSTLFFVTTLFTLTITSGIASAHSSSVKQSSKNVSITCSDDRGGYNDTNHYFYDCGPTESVKNGAVRLGRSSNTITFSCSSSNNIEYSCTSQSISQTYLCSGASFMCHPTASKSASTDTGSEYDGTFALNVEDVEPELVAVLNQQNESDMQTQPEQPTEQGTGNEAPVS